MHANIVFFLRTACLKHRAELPYLATSRSTACALLSDHGYLLIQAFFQALQSYSWRFALIQSLSKHRAMTALLVLLRLKFTCRV